MNFLTNLWNWVDERLPVQRAWDTHMGSYYAPKNFNFWYFFGVLSLLVLVNQLLTGIWLTMMYVPDPDKAFASVEYIMRDVDYGWIIRYMHSTGASAFFAVVYLHMFRALLYGSYRKPRELLWIFGMLIYLALMAEGFLGYVLPWGQMSYWGAQVIVSLFGAIPGIGEGLVEWIRGDYLISGITLNRFFALHVVALPIVILALVVLHILALHEVGSNNPDGVEIKKNKDENGIPKDGVPFHPYYSVHDLVGIGVFLFIFSFIIFFMPEMGGFFLEYANFEEANALKTPAHIAPVWYYTPFYSILRAVTINIGPLDAKFLGFVAMGAAIAIMFVLPWLDRAKAKSHRYKGKVTKMMLGLFVANFFILGVMGVKAPTDARTLLAQIATVYYFAFFITMPWWSQSGVKSLKGSIVSWIFGLVILYMSIFNGLMSEGDSHLVYVGIVGLILGLFMMALPVLTARDSELDEPERVTMNGGMGTGKALLALIAIAVITVLPLKAAAAGGDDVKLDPMPAINLNDKESLQSGASLYMNYCHGCHAMKFMRYERIADDLHIPHEIMMANANFSGRPIGNLMDVAVDDRVIKGWFGATPPDLTMVARSRSPEWLYTYLRTFYRDESRPMGVNNKVFKDVGMPHAMLELQGLQGCVGAGEDPCEELGLIQEGTMSPEEYDKAVYDLVNFLEYAGEPSAVDRQSIGIWVLFWCLLFIVVAYFLNKEFWRDIH